MPTRRLLNPLRAFAELGFVAAAFICGVLGAPTWCAGLVGLAMLAYWGFTRRDALQNMPLSRAAIQGGIAIVVMIVVLAAAYAAGLAVRGLA